CSSSRVAWCADKLSKGWRDRDVASRSPARRKRHIKRRKCCPIVAWLLLYPAKSHCGSQKLYGRGLRNLCSFLDIVLALSLPCRISTFHWQRPNSDCILHDLDFTYDLSGSHCPVRDNYALARPESSI